MRFATTAVFALCMVAFAAPALALTADEAAMKKVLDDSAEAWNHGDIKGFVAISYERSPTTVYLTAQGPVIGYDAIESLYTQRWSKRAGGPGTLSTENLQFKPLSPDYAIVYTPGCSWRRPSTSDQGYQSAPPGPRASCRARSTGGRRSGAPRGSWPGSLAIISCDQKWRIAPSRRVKTAGPPAIQSAVRAAAVVAREGVGESAGEPQVLPAPLALHRRQPLQRRARDHHQRHPLGDVVGVAVPGVQQVGAHRARPLPLGTEHVVVDHQRLLIAEQAGEVAWAVSVSKR
jgi:hypothetical protein